MDRASASTPGAIVPILARAGCGSDGSDEGGHEHGLEVDAVRVDIRVVDATNAAVVGSVISVGTTSSRR